MKIYQDMKLEIILFYVQDVITASDDLSEETDDTAKDFEW